MKNIFIWLLFIPNIIFCDLEHNERFDLIECVYNKYFNNFHVEIVDKEENIKYVYALETNQLWNNNVFDIIIWNIPLYSDTVEWSEFSEKQKLQN